MNTTFKRKQIFGIRTTNQFVVDFDQLCSRLGHNRSEVARYCLKKFLIENGKDQSQLQRIKNELF